MRQAVAKSPVAVRAARFVSAQPRAWEDAPGAVVLAVGLAWFAGAASAVALTVSTALLVFRGADAADGFSVSASLLSAAVWLIHSHRTARPVAWWLQILLSAFCLAGLPVLTLIHGLLLVFWIRPEVRRWYAPSP